MVEGPASVAVSGWWARGRAARAWITRCATTGSRALELGYATSTFYLTFVNAQTAVAQLRVLGGAMARMPVEATAFAHRGRRIMVALGAVYERPNEAAVHEAWVTGFAAALGQGDEGEARVRDAYPGPTWDRLAAIKSRYDPTNLFRHNQNIRPTAGRREDPTRADSSE